MSTEQQMTALEIARKLVDLGQMQDACRAYELVMRDENGTTALEKLEGAIFCLQLGEDYKVSYDCFLKLYRQDQYRAEILPILSDAFYAPNEQELKKRYELNCRLLKKYSYLFRKDFIPFEDLPVRFFPYDDKGYVPFDTRTGEFGEYVNFNHQVISRNFFRDLEKPVLADDVFSQYELEYLRDNVRKSEWVARDNHVYLHYTDWAVFCSYLQCLELREVLKEEKVVFLIEDEIARYPINFKEEYGIDYSQYPVKDISVREINRLIWHIQLSAHNGGDFFNEIFFGHPNLILLDSLMMFTIEEMVETIQNGIKVLKKTGDGWGGLNVNYGTIKVPILVSQPAFQELLTLKSVSKKDALIAAFLAIATSHGQSIDPACRIVPAVFLQPHFYNFIYKLERHSTGCAYLSCATLEEAKSSPIFTSFKYIKTVAPLRRITTSYSATIRFADKFQLKQKREKGEMDRPTRFYDILGQRVLMRSYLVDPDDRLFKDSVIVRFEDAKLNSKATFTALAEFMDIPYTKSMEECSNIYGVISDGFRTNSVFNTYDEFANFDERYYLEYLMRDAYEAYGYDFHFYDGAPVDDAKLKKVIDGFDPANAYMMRLRSPDGSDPLAQYNMTDKQRERYIADCKERIKEHNEMRFLVGQIIGPLPTFVNKDGVPLKMIPMLHPDPELLENELYH